MSDRETSSGKLDLPDLWMTLQDLEDGTLDPGQREDLMARLEHSPAARRAYFEYFQQSAVFKMEGAKMHEHGILPVVDSSFRHRRMFQRSIMAAAAVVVLGAVIMKLIPSPPPPLTFATSPGTEFGISHALVEDHAPEGQVMEVGSRLQVRHGTVELIFDSGVRGIVRGPADMTLHSENQLHFSHGTAWFEVSPEAVGFKVKTPDFLLTDLGTEFGVISKREFLDEVHVFTGKVEVVARHGVKKEMAVGAGQARKVGPAGRWNEIPPRPDHFLKSLPLVPTAYFGQSTIIVNGLGQDQNKPVPPDLGSRVSEPVPGVDVTDGGTPSIALHWSGGGDNGWQLHGKHRSLWDALDPADPDDTVNVAQMEYPTVVSPSIITFTVDEGAALKLNSVDIGVATDKTHTYVIAISLSEVDGPTVFEHTTADLDGDGSSGPRIERVTIDFTGEPGRDYVLSFDDVGTDTNGIAIDNLSFTQLGVGPGG